MFSVIKIHDCQNACELREVCRIISKIADGEYKCDVNDVITGHLSPTELSDPIRICKIKILKNYVCKVTFRSIECEN